MVARTDRGSTSSRAARRSRAIALAAVAATSLLALGGARPQPASGLAVDATPPGGVQLLANCLDLCTVTVVLSGNGSGSLLTTNSSNVADGKINCVWSNGAQAPGSDCSEVYGGVDRVSPVRVYFRIAPVVGNEACYANTCDTGTFTSYIDLLSKNVPVVAQLSASFTRITYGVSTSKSGTGTGIIVSTPAGIDCGAACATLVYHGTALVLTATPATGSYFDHWTGSCAGQGTACHLTVTSPIDTTATFILGDPPTASPPAPTPTATAQATTTATVRPTASPRATAAHTNSPSQAAPSGPAASDPADTEAPATAGEPTIDATGGPAPSNAPTSVVGTEPPIAPTGSSGFDLTPIVIAILGAGLLIAIGIGVAAFALRRRPAA